MLKCIFVYVKWLIDFINAIGIGLLTLKRAAHKTTQHFYTTLSKHGWCFPKTHCQDVAMELLLSWVFLACFIAVLGCSSWLLGGWTTYLSCAMFISEELKKYPCIQSETGYYTKLFTELKWVICRRWAYTPDSCRYLYTRKLTSSLLMLILDPGWTKRSGREWSLE